MSKIYLISLLKFFVAHIFLYPSTIIGAEIKVEAVKVVDGDTIKVHFGNQFVRVRLKGIDAPEANQPFGPEATEYLSLLVKGLEVTISYEDVDRYGRILGKILVDGKDINLQMLEHGYAWSYRYYRDQQTSDDQRLYRDAQSAAKASKLGIWANDQQIPPYEWRKKESAN